MAKVILFGEPMALLIADTVGPLEDVEHFTRAMSGAEVNVAIGLTRLGHDVEYLTKLGDDPFGHYIEKTLVKNKIGTRLISYDSIYRTGIQLKNRVADGSDPHAPYYRKGSAASHITKEDIDKINLNGIDLIHITGIPPAISQSARQATFRLAVRAKENNIFLTFDPNLRPALWEDKETMVEVLNKLSKYADLILPGEEEGEILAGTTDNKEIANFYHNHGVKIVVVKNGSEGAYYSDGNDSGQVSGFKVDRVVDTVGAGDGFAVGVISGIIEGKSMFDSVVRGNAIGAIQVTNVSDNEGLPNREQLSLFLNSGK